MGQLDLATVLKVLRALSGETDLETLGELSRVGAETLAQATRAGLDEDVRPGIVVSIATAGDLLQWHPTFGAGS